MSRMKSVLVALHWTGRTLLAFIAAIGLGFLIFRRRPDDAPVGGTENQDRVREAIERGDLDSLKDEVLR